ncbi:phage portal protein [Piscirickettsia litoralis]|uniref:Phage portal protein n=2 Tax=Piscirickettsia litoralis TaxID=1891921 RepID=A0ABX2ZYH0_9GAMM|nr:phage portal protein [Piscirickettsia litoralis]
MSMPSYEGATRGSRLANYGLSESDGPISSVSSSEQVLRSRARNIERNNSWGRSTVTTYVTNIVGTGIKPNWQLKDKTLKEEIQVLWKDWSKKADTAGTLNFYGLQALACRTQGLSGECLARFRYRRFSDPLAVPFQIELLEPDYLDMAIDKNFDNGHRLRQGIEFNKLGQKVAYYLTTEHPGDDWLFGNPATKRIKARDLLQIFEPLRPGQIRGVSMLAPIILRLVDLDKYEDAELIRKTIASMITGFVTSAAQPAANASDFMNQLMQVGSDQEKLDIAFDAGTIFKLNPGDDFRLAEADDSGDNLVTWTKNQLRGVAQGAGITYEQLTGDLEGVNYSSIRAGLLEARRRFEMLQHLILSHQFNQPVAEKWLDIAVLSGRLKIKDYWENRHIYHRIEWQPDGWDWVDPLKDAMAKVIEVRAGFKSRAAVVSESGADVEQLDQQNAEDQKRQRDLDLKYDSNVNDTTKTGVFQKAEELAYSSSE